MEESNNINSLGANSFKKIPNSDAQQFFNEFAALSIDGNSLKNEFLIELSSFTTAVDSNQKRYINFLPIEERNKLTTDISFFIHLSNSITEFQRGDSLFLLRKKNGRNNFYEVVTESDTAKYNTLKNTYITGLGRKINQATVIANTETITYERQAISNYINVDLPNELNNLGSINVIGLKFKLVKFKPINTSPLNLEYTSRENKISFAFCAAYEDNNARGIALDSSQLETAYFDFAGLRP